MPSSDNSLPQHSPGPFTHGNTRLSPVSIYSPQYRSACIAKVYLTHPGSKKRTPEFAANLRLFTESAEMYAAIREAIPILIWAAQRRADAQAVADRFAIIVANLDG